MRQPRAIAIVALAGLVIPVVVQGGPPSISQRIDALLAQAWEGDKIEPAQTAGDAEFLRRVSLDVQGTLPMAGQVRLFLEDTHPDKRAILIDQMLESPLFAQHLADLWTRILMGPGIESPESQQLNEWLRDRFASNLRYDRLAADLLADTGNGDPGPAAYFQAMEFKPEKLAASSARIFLGMRLECAQCHHHPYDHWKQDDFWGYAAFFARVAPNESAMQRSGGLQDRATGEVTLPDTETVVYPRYPSGRDADRDSLGTRRQWLALWMASPDNHFLARAVVNRVWGHLFGMGLVDPVDDLGPNNPPSHPQLLEELSEAFVQSGYDLRELYRGILNSGAYQRSSAYLHSELPPPESFAVMATKPLSPEQIGRSLLRMAGGQADTGMAMLVEGRLRQMQTGDGDMQASVPQALMMMNGQVTQAVTADQASRLVRALSAPFLSPEERLETLYLATVSRLPTGPERERLLPLIGQDEQAAGDVLWSLLNSAEFLLNH
jgi:hypothetical protein